MGEFENFIMELVLALMQLNPGTTCLWGNWPSSGRRFSLLDLGIFISLGALETQILAFYWLCWSISLRILIGLKL